jgi:hypothetical protein
MLSAVIGVAKCILSSPVLRCAKNFFLKPNILQCQMYCGEAYINSYETHNERRGNRKTAAPVQTWYISCIYDTQDLPVYVLLLRQL